MTETLVEPPPPPTVRDEALTGQSTKIVRRRKAIVIALAIVALLLGAVAAALYFLVWQYKPTARRHIPGNANIVARAEIASVVLFGPIRKHFSPILFDQAPTGGVLPGASGSKTTPAERIREATGVNVATDIREMLIASVDARTWVVLLGGRIAKGGVVAGFERLVQENGWTGWHRDGALLLGPPGVQFALGQAEDGTIAFGTHRDIVGASLPATDEWQRLGLPTDGAITFAITHDAWTGTLGLAGSLLPVDESVRAVERVTGRATLGSTPTLDVWFRPYPGENVARLASDLERSIAALRLLLLLAPDVAGEKEALASARVKPLEREVLTTALLSYEGLDRACERLAALIRPSRVAVPVPSSVEAPRRR